MDDSFPWLLRVIYRSSSIKTTPLYMRHDLFCSRRRVGEGALSLCSFMELCFFMRLRDMALACSCLTFWVSCIDVPMLFDPPITTHGLSWDKRVGAGRGASRLGLVQVS